MKISIFGNVNNYPYTLALGLRSLGINAVLVVNSRELLNRPESKRPELAGNYPNWILDCSGLSDDDFIAEASRTGGVLNFLWEGSDGVILNHLGPSLLSSLNLPAISLLTGSDLTYYGNYDSVFVNHPSPGARLLNRNWRKFVDRQRLGILSSRGVSYAPRGMLPDGDQILQDIGVDCTKRFFVYMTDTAGLKPAAPSLRDELRIFNGARLNWKELPHGFVAQDDKATDRLLRGFARFIGIGGRAKLVLVEKGLHVEHTKSLAASLGLGDRIEWLPEMSLAAFHDQVRLADVVCDQLGRSFPGMVALDSMALGRPVLANFRLDILGPAYSEPWPVCNCTTDDEVFRALVRLESKELRQTLGAAGRLFAERHLSAEANAVKCLDRLLEIGRPSEI